MILDQHFCFKKLAEINKPILESQLSSNSASRKKEIQPQKTLESNSFPFLTIPKEPDAYETRYWKVITLDAFSGFWGRKQILMVTQLQRM